MRILDWEIVRSKDIKEARVSSAQSGRDRLRG